MRRYAMFVKRRFTRPRRRGAVLAWMAFLLPVLLAATGLCVDLGRIFIGRAKLQAAVDLASLSAVIQVPNTVAGEAAAIDILTRNESEAAAGYQSGDVEFGNWDPDTRTFTPGGTPLNAARVSAGREAARGNPVPLFFLPILGESFSDVTAVGVSFAVPRVGGFASGGLIGKEHVDIGGTSLIDGYDFNAGPYGGDNAGLPGTALSNGSMVVHGTPVITGDARPGVAFTEATVKGNATVEGTTQALTKPLDLAPVVTPTSITDGANDNSNITAENDMSGESTDVFQGFDLTAGQNETVTIPTGDYYLEDFTVRGTVNITGPARIRVTEDMRITSDGLINVDGTNGPVEFYLEGSGTLAGQGIVNIGQDPRDLIIYSTGPSLRWEGGSDFYGFLYGPDDPVISIRGDADFFGGAVGRELEIAGTGDIHTERGNGFDGPNRKLPILVD